MLKKVFRAILQCVVFGLLLPLKILALLYVVIKVIQYKVQGILDVRESLSIFWEGLTEQFSKEMHWVKTGEII